MLNINKCTNHSPSVKLRAGASIVKKKLVFSFDSRFILVPSGCDVKVFSIVSGECILTFKKHQKPVISVQLSKRNCLQALSCSEDCVVIRWDYTDGTFLMKYTFKLNATPSTFVAATPSLWFVTAKYDDHYRVYSVDMKSSSKMIINMHLKKVLPFDNAIAVGHKGSYVAAIFENCLQVKDLQSKIYKRHTTGEKELLCIAAHPSKYILATGDNLGCILIWSNFFQSNHPTRSICHWHSLPLSDLTFSVEGSHVYSGGGECVLVKWNLNSGTKQTLPRLGLPICHVAVSPDNTYIATSHVDNAIQIISSQNKIVQAIQGLTQGHFSNLTRNETLPTGMIYDPRLNAIVMNGRPGHLQFYNISDDRQLFNLDIVGQNYICQERESIVFNTDVEKVAIDSKGLWLATAECRDDGETSIEIRLKFWKFEVSSQKFVLNTNVFLPHHKRINNLKFQPFFDDDQEKDEILPLAVSTSNDGRFKIWTLSETDKKGEKYNWFCESMGYYKELPAGDASFSEDGSLLAVNFNHIITLWSPDTNVLKANISKCENTDPIKYLEFGKGKCSHFLVASTDKKVSVWNILSLTVLWNVDCRVNFLAADSFSEVMALFSKDNDLYIFKPSESKLIAILKDVSSSPVVAAVFVPNESSNNYQSKNSCCWQQSTKLYFLNENQEVLTVMDESELPENEADMEKIKLQQNLPSTPYGLLQAESIVSHVKPLKSEKHVFYEFGKEENMEIADLPCPTHVNPITLCKAVLPSLLIPRHRDKEQMSSKNTSDVESNDSDSDAKDEDDEVIVTTTTAPKEEIIKPMDLSELILPKLKDFEYLLLDTVAIK